MRNGKVAAILFSAPAEIPAGKVKVPVSLQEKEYLFVTMDGTEKAEFQGDTLKLPAFEGMLMLVSEEA